MSILIKTISISLNDSLKKDRSSLPGYHTSFTTDNMLLLFAVIPATVRAQFQQNSYFVKIFLTAKIPSVIEDCHQISCNLPLLHHLWFQMNAGPLRQSVTTWAAMRDVCAPAVYKTRRSYQLGWEGEQGRGGFLSEQEMSFLCNSLWFIPPPLTK